MSEARPGPGILCTPPHGTFVPSPGRPMQDISIKCFVHKHSSKSLRVLFFNCVNMQVRQSVLCRPKSTASLICCNELIYRIF
jgi:hypothetical protein